MLDNDPAEILVVIGPGTATNEALAFAAALRLVRPGGGRHPGPGRGRASSLLTQALRSGVREVVPAGDHAALAAACKPLP